MRNKEVEYERFKKHLRKKGLTLTSGREIVFKLVMDIHGHFAAEEVVKICLKRQQHVSRATIYRSLRELLEGGLIRKTAFGEKHEHYEHVYDEKLHHHARCIRCYRVIEFPCHHCDQEYLSILQKEKFQVLGHEMHFYGICEQCSR